MDTDCTIQGFSKAIENLSGKEALAVLHGAFIALPILTANLEPATSTGGAGSDMSTHLVFPGGVLPGIAGTLVIPTAPPVLVMRHVLLLAVIFNLTGTGTNGTLSVLRSLLLFPKLKITVHVDPRSRFITIATAYAHPCFPLVPYLSTVYVGSCPPLLPVPRQPASEEYDLLAIPSVCFVYGTS